MLPFTKSVVALCLWREARGEPLDGQRAVLHVIKNRGGDPLGQVTKKWQFSSMTAVGDSQLILYPTEEQVAPFELLVDKVWTDDLDLTNGATHYFNPSVVLPSWAEGMVKTVSIGHHDFYK